MLRNSLAIRRIKAIVTCVVVSAVVGVSPSQAAGLTAGDLLKQMQSKDLVYYVSGMVEGFAYARFRKDTIAAGEKVESGMQCIRDWYLNTPRIILTIEDAFRQYADHQPSVILAALIKKECGE